MARIPHRFTQLAAELIALAQSQDLTSLYGAVTIGDVWRFGHLDAVRKHITQDIALFTIPDDLAQVMGVLYQITLQMLQMLALIPQPLLPKREKGSRIEVPLPKRERA